jgi:translation initiation factor 2 subunit 1
MVKTSEYPDESDLVVGTVREVKGFGAFVALDEYPGKAGFIPVGEVASGWVKYIRDFVREGQKVVCKVLRVTPSRGHVDLSLKAVNEHQRREKIQEWKNEQKAERLFEIVANNMKKTVEECYDEFGLELVDKFGSLFSAFEECAIDKTALKKEGFKGKWVKQFVKVAVENIAPPHVIIKGIINMTCPGAKGVEKIKTALLAAQEIEDGGVKIQYVGAPRYRIEVKALDYKRAEDAMKNAVEIAIKQIEALGGEASFKREEKD